MLILEGADLVGKTTLSELLLKELPKHIYGHFSKLPDGFEKYWGYQPFITENVVMDRFHLSRQAYGSVTGDQERFTPTEMVMMQGALSRVGSYCAILTADEEVIIQRYEHMDSARQELYGLETILKVNRQYAYLADGLHNHPHYSTYHIRQHTLLPEIAEKLLSQYRKRRDEHDGLLLRKPRTFYT